MNDATILYYSANAENPEFEKKIQETILENSGGLPIVSVTHKPTDFGKNICVGLVGASEMNMLRQILIGCKAATTKYVISAEADCLYGPDYFRMRPPTNDVCYRNTNTYLMPFDANYFFKKKEGGTWAQIINRELYIERLEFLLEGAPEWDANAKRFVKEKGLKLFDYYGTFTTEAPCISIKTGNGMRKYSHSEKFPFYELPYWGSAKVIRKMYSI